MSSNPRNPNSQTQRPGRSVRSIPPPPAPTPPPPADVDQDNGGQSAGSGLPPRRRNSGAGRYTGTVILVGVFALLGAVLILLNNNPNAGVINPTATPRPPPVVWDLSAGTASGLSVQTLSQTVALQVIGNQWQITAPTNEPASQFQVGAAADQLKKITAQQVITTPGDLKQFGLDAPVMTVTLIISGVTPPENTLYVGAAVTDGGSYYVKAKDKGEVYVVLNTLIEQLRSWTTTPPKAEPSPTPLLILSPTPTPPVSGTVTTTIGVPIGPVPPSPGGGGTPTTGAATSPTAGATAVPSTGTPAVPTTGAVGTPVP